MSLIWGFVKANIGTGILYAAIALVAYLGFNRFMTLEKQNDALTKSLTQVTQILEGEVERSKNVEAVTERLESNDAERQRQLRGFERNLAKVAKDSAEARLILSTVIPDSMLTGLRSFQNTSRDLPGQPGAIAPVVAP